MLPGSREQSENPEAVLMFNCGRNDVSLYTNCKIFGMIVSSGPSDNQGPAETPDSVILWNIGL